VIKKDGEKMLGRCKATKSPDMRNHHLYFDTCLNWRRSQSRSNLLLQNGHEVSVAECAVLLFLAAEQLRQCRSSGFFFSTTLKAPVRAPNQLPWLEHRKGEGRPGTLKLASKGPSPCNPNLNP
jgi:hypothetical protein